MSTESHTSPLIRIVDDDDSMRMAPRDYLARKPSAEASREVNAVISQGSYPS
jgi:hypothetical protein